MHEFRGIVDSFFGSPRAEGDGSRPGLEEVFLGGEGGWVDR